MAAPKLLQSWERTESYLTAAHEGMSSLATTQETREVLAQALELIRHNELGVASDWLLGIAKESHWSSVAILSPLALAQASMGRAQEQALLDARLSELRGAT